MSSLSPPKQQCQRIHQTTTQQSRNTNAYFERNDYHHRQQYWHSHRQFHSNKKGRYEHLPPRHRPQPTLPTNKPQASTSLSSTNSEASTNRKELQTKNLAAAAIAARQQNSSPQANLNVVQNLMNSLILQQQQQQQPASQSQSTIQLQYQLTNALLATMIQQRLKEATLQAQAQQIQAALPTLFAAQALAHPPPNIAHPGTKFNNRPLVKFPVPRSNPFIPISRPRLDPTSNTHLPTYQQIQEIERGISLDEAIHSKGAIDITTD